MNKQDFLQELQSRIRILEEAEQQDILAEYAQHIDLRMAGRLSEEEAIQDFGDPGSWPRRILEAYHVDPSRLSTPAQPKQAAQALRRSAAGIRDRFCPPGTQHLREASPLRPRHRRLVAAERSAAEITGTPYTSPQGHQ